MCNILISLPKSQPVAAEGVWAGSLALVLAIVQNPLQFRLYPPREVVAVEHLEKQRHFALIFS